ncbi:MAG: MauE/DoxX family redox-associated membrane protein [Chloroherpetonaceae bacterium]|nr:DoxX family membrane protein [bacterium]
MKKLLNNEYVLLICRIIVGLMFIVVGVGKIANPEEFAKEIANYQILPYLFVNITAIIIPWIELFTGILLLLGVQTKSSSIVIAVMTVVFTIAVIIAIAKGLNIECGCYSNIASQQVGLPKVLENIGLLILTFIIILSDNKKFSLK